MKNRFSTYLKGLMFVGLLTFSSVAVLPATAHAAGKSCSTSSVLTFPAWYKNLPLDSDCHPQITALKQVWVIVLNGIEILLQIVGYVSVGYIMWGGIKYMKSQGDPSGISQARGAITDAVVGLIIAISAVAIVSFISGGISGTTENGIPTASADSGALSGVLNKIVFPIAGAISVIFIIVGGIQYAVSNGDSGKTKKARETIIYSIVGLVFVIMAFAIVQLVLGRFQ